MPQLDILAYAAELFWFVAVFSSLYVYVLCVLVPSVVRNLLYRRAVLVRFNSYKSNSLSEFLIRIEQRSQKLNGLVSKIFTKMAPEVKNTYKVFVDVQSVFPITNEDLASNSELVLTTNLNNNITLK